MYRHILVPTDGSPLSQKAVAGGLALAKTLTAKVTGFIAVPDFILILAQWGEERWMPPKDYRHYKEAMEREAHKYLGFIKQTAVALGVQAETEYETHNSPYLAIIKAAEKNHCDLIVMASHGRKGIGGLVLGSETTKVLTHSKIPVLVYR